MKEDEEQMLIKLDTEQYIGSEVRLADEQGNRDNGWRYRGIVRRRISHDPERWEPIYRGPEQRYRVVAEGDASKEAERTERLGARILEA